MSDPTPQQQLNKALRDYDADSLKRALEQGADPNAQDGNGWTPLTYAAGADDRAGCQILVEAGADVNLANADGYRPLHEAARFDSAEAGFWLIEQGADPNALDGQGRTPLDLMDEDSRQEVQDFIAARETTQFEADTAHITDDWNPSMGEEAPVQGDSERPARQRMRL